MWEQLAHLWRLYGVFRASVLIFIVGVLMMQGR